MRGKTKKLLNGATNAVSRMFNKAKSKWNMGYLYQVYSRQQAVNRMYTRWFDFYAQFDVQNEYLVNVESIQPSLVPVGDWPEISQGWLK